MEKSYEYRTGASDAGKTVKQILTGYFHLGSAQIKKAKFRENGILVNEKQVTVRYILQEGDILRVLIEDAKQASKHLVPMEGNLHIIYEDEDCLVVEKPAGMVCHPSGGHYADSMANLLVGHYQKQGIGFVVRLAGRLDKDTSGMLLYAKNAPALTEFEKQRRNGTLSKTYYAVVEGIPEEKEGIIDAFMEDDPDTPMKQRVCAREQGGQRAITHYRVLKAGRICGTAIPPAILPAIPPAIPSTIPSVIPSVCSLLEVHIETGRTHQIRCHMSWMGHPLLGDGMYGSASQLIGRHALHAGKIQFLLPASKDQVCCSCDMPEDMRKVMEMYGLGIS